MGKFTPVHVRAVQSDGRGPASGNESAESRRNQAAGELSIHDGNPGIRLTNPRRSRQPPKVIQTTVFSCRLGDRPLYCTSRYGVQLSRNGTRESFVQNSDGMNVVAESTGDLKNCKPMSTAYWHPGSVWRALESRVRSRLLRLAGGRRISERSEV